jgi:hypothetical protein
MDSQNRIPVPFLFLFLFFCYIFSTYNMAQSTPLKRLSVLTERGDLNNLHLPTITDDAQDVIGLHGKSLCALYEHDSLCQLRAHPITKK